MRRRPYRDLSRVDGHSEALRSVSQIKLTLSRRLAAALGGAVAALAIAGSASAEVTIQFQFQDRDVARMVSLGGSCSRCELSGRDLTGAAFTGASFLNATLVGANLRGAELVGSNFSGATLTGTNLSGATLLRATGLTQGRLNQACGDETTRLPRGLTIPRC